MVTYQPTANFAHNNKFKFTLTSLPNVEFFGVEYQTPDMSLSHQKVAYRQGYTNLAPDKVDFGTLSVTFKINETYSNYIEIMEWVKGIGKPESYQERIDLVSSRAVVPGQKHDHLVYSDASIICLNNSSQPEVEISFKNAMPVSLSGINYSTKVTADVPLEATIVFVVDSMKFIPIIK